MTLKVYSSEAPRPGTRPPLALKLIQDDEDIDIWLVEEQTGKLVTRIMFLSPNKEDGYNYVLCNLSSLLSDGDRTLRIMDGGVYDNPFEVDQDGYIVRYNHA